MTEPGTDNVNGDTIERARAEAYAYPSGWEADVVLSDGGTVHLRPIIPDDADSLVAFHARLSERTRYLRYFGAYPRIPQRDLARFSVVDHRDRVALLALLGDDVVAVGRYERIDGGSSAEVAFVVDDAHQGRGLGSILLEHLAAAAGECGLTRFVAEVLAENTQMVRVFRDAGYQVSRELEEGVVHLEFDIDPTEESLAVARSREQAAEARSVHNLLHPRSVAVIGASTDPTKIGYAVLSNLLAGDFAGTVYPVNPEHGSVRGVRTYPSVVDIPDSVDLAVVAVPADKVEGVLDGALEKGIKTLVIVSAGFAESGPRGLHAEVQLVGEARANGMRVVGPNALGVLNTDTAVRLNATLAPRLPARGHTGFLCQSGALGVAILADAEARGLGLSTFVSAGNRADVSGNDLLQYWETDPATDVVLLYLESFGNPRKFARIARRVSNQKPIVAVKSGRSQAGERAAASHTGSLAAGDVAVDALFRQAGVIRTETLDELFDVANLLAHQSLPAGNRVAILTNAGGLGVMCADACEADGLELPELSPGTVARLRKLLPAEAGVTNPVDMIASATAEHYGEALRVLAADEKVDSIIVIFIPPLVTRAEDVARALMEASAAIGDKTVLSCFLGVRGVHEHLRSAESVIPSHAFPESAARALARVSQYAAWRGRPEGSVPDFPDVDRDRAAALAASQLGGGARWLEPAAVADLLALYGIRHARTAVGGTPDEVGEAARDIGGRVVVKIDSRTILHKTDVGGVRLDLRSPEDASAAADEMLARLEDQGLAGEVEGFIVQEMVSGEGAEMFVGMSHDPLFGPLVACGAGGVLVELQRDVATRLTPLTDFDVDEMLRSLKTYPLLEGYRGSPRLDVAALQELLLRVGMMVEDIPQLSELDLNPVMVLPEGEGCVALDARMRIAEPIPAAPRGSRWRPTPA
jgi:acetyl coenzyme A synthetase (ADP forming)-like protein